MVKIVRFVFPSLSLIEADHGSSAGWSWAITCVVYHNDSSIPQGYRVTVALSKHGGQLPMVGPGETAIIGLGYKQVFVRCFRLTSIVHLQVPTLQQARWVGGQQGTLITDTGQQVSARQTADSSFCGPITQDNRPFPGLAAIDGSEQRQASRARGDG